jgi:hypothetical protein
MPTPQQPTTPAPDALEGMPETADRAEQRFRTVAVRVQEDLHSQLSFIAQLSGRSISEEIRQAIEGRITTAQDDPDLVARAAQVRDEIEREATARTAAIAGFMGKKAVVAAGDARTPRRRSKTNNN